MSDDFKYRQRVWSRRITDEEYARAVGAETKEPSIPVCPDCGQDYLVEVRVDKNGPKLVPCKRTRK